MSFNNQVTGSSLLLGNIQLAPKVLKMIKSGCPNGGISEVVTGGWETVAFYHSTSV